MAAVPDMAVNLFVNEQGYLPPDLHALASRLAADPRDVLTVQALADWVEEAGGECAPLRALWVDDGDVIVLGVDPSTSLDRRDVVLASLNETLGAWLRGCGREVYFLAVPASWTIRQIKTAARPEGRE